MQAVVHFHFLGTIVKLLSNTAMYQDGVSQVKGSLTTCIHSHSTLAVCSGTMNYPNNPYVLFSRWLTKPTHLVHGKVNATMQREETRPRNSDMRGTKLSHRPIPIKMENAGHKRPLDPRRQTTSGKRTGSLPRLC